jgi:hypothetical protein
MLLAMESDLADNFYNNSRQGMLTDEEGSVQLTSLYILV